MPSTASITASRNFLNYLQPLNLKRLIINNINIRKKVFIIGGKKKEFNKYEIKGKMTIIFTENKKGDKFEIIIDTEELDRIISLGYYWGVEKAHTGLKPYYGRTTLYQGIVNGKPKYKILRLHRVIVNAKRGDIVDHINRNTLDDRKENLRIINKSSNSRNRNCPNANNKSGYRNISLDKKTNKWMVQLQVNGKNTRLGEFPFNKLDDAVKFTKEMREKYYGIYAGE